MRPVRFGTLLLAGATIIACSSNIGAKPGTEDAGVPDVDGGTDASATYAIGGAVSGLNGTGLVLQNNAGDDIAVAKNGTFTFPKKLAKGAAFSISIKTQPSAPQQTCSVSGGSGTVVAGDVTTVAINCAVGTFTVGGTVSGLAGAGLVLQNSGGGELVVNENGTFAFPAPVASGGAYAVTVKSQPNDPSQTCAVTNGAGTIEKTNVADVVIACTTNHFKVGGNVTGLSGEGLTLQINGGETLPVSSTGTFTFPTALASNSAFVVTVSAQPTNPAQKCEVSGGSGTIGGADVASVTVNCSTSAFTIAGTASGLLGAVKLQNNGGDDLVVAANGTFSFATAVASNSPYAVTVLEDPTTPSQKCTVTNASGTVTTAAISNVVLECVTNTYKVKGHINGLAGTGLALRNNGGDEIVVGAQSDFEFAIPVASGQTYAVTVSSQPSTPSQTCLVTNASGKVGGVDVTDVVVDCTTDDFTVGGAIAGLSGSGLTLLNNLGDELAVTAGETAFTFPSSILSGGDYDVTIKTQPSNPTQHCDVTAGKGSVTNGNVVTVNVNCTTSSFAVGGTTSGLAGVGLVLQNNGGDDLTLSSNNAWAFGQPIASNGAYAVTIKTQPVNPSQTCIVDNASGTVTNGAVNNVAVTCKTDTFEVGGTVSGLKSGTLVLLNNSADEISLTANGTFEFPTKIASHANYAVIVKTQPAGLYCTVTNAAGVVGAANITNVGISCVDAYASCLALPSGSPSGIYKLDPDGTGPNAPFDTFCDMVTDGGGWMLLVNRYASLDNNGQPDLNQVLGTFDNARGANWQHDVSKVYPYVTSFAFASKHGNACPSCALGSYDSAIKVAKSSGPFTTMCNGSIAASYTKLVGASAGTSGTAYWCDGALAWGVCDGKPCHYGVHSQTATSDGSWSSNAVQEMHFPSQYSSYRYYDTAGKWCRSCSGGLTPLFNGSSSCCRTGGGQDNSVWTIWAR